MNTSTFYKHIINSTIAIGLITWSLFVCFPKAIAQTNADAKNFVSWSQEASRTYYKGATIINDLADIEVSIDDLVNGEITRRIAERFVTRRILQAERNIEEFRSLVNNFPHLEATHFEYIAISTELEAYVSSMPNFVDRYIGTIKEMFAAALSGDEERYNKLSVLTYSKRIFLLQGENNFARTYTAVTKEGQPSLPLIQCMISINEAVIELLEFNANFYSGENFDALGVSNSMKIFLGEARHFLDDAEKIIRPFGSHLRSSYGLTFAQEKLTYAIEDSLRKSIIIERNLVDVVTNLSDLIAQIEDTAPTMSEVEFQEYLAEFDRGGTLMNEFVQGRFKEQQHRTEIAQTLMREF